MEAVDLLINQHHTVVTLTDGDENPARNMFSRERRQEFIDAGYRPVDESDYDINGDLPLQHWQAEEAQYAKRGRGVKKAANGSGTTA